MDKDFYDRTRLDLQIQSLVGTRINQSWNADNTYPKIVYNSVNAGIRVKSHGDPNTDDIRKSMVIVDIMSKDNSIYDIADRMEELWDEYRRTAYGATEFVRVALVGNANLPAEMPLDNSELGILRRSMDFEVHWRKL